MVDEFFIVKCLYYGPECVLCLWLYGVVQGFIVSGVVELTISFQSVLLSVHDNYF